MNKVKKEHNALFYVKPWVWKQESKNPDYISWEPEGNWGDYRVSKWDDDEHWTASYCFNEYYDESDAKFDDIEDAKKWCWENWMGRLLPHLIHQNKK